MHIDPIWIALIGTLFGGAGLKILEHWLGKTKTKTDEATRLREELRIEIVAGREEIKELEAAVEKWKKEYYDLRDEVNILKVDYKIQLDILRRELAAAESTLASRSAS